MKYFLIKEEEHYEDGRFIYKTITDVSIYTRSKEIMICDDKCNNMWYSFLFEPDAKLYKVKKSRVTEQLSLVSDEKQKDERLESFHEVSEKVFFDFLEMYKGLLKSHKRFKKDSKDFERIYNKIKKIKDTHEKY